MKTKNKQSIKIGIIGGTGLDDPQLINNPQVVKVKTKYGQPSSPLTIGSIQNINVVIIARHGLQHQTSPSRINYRANIWALKQQGCTHIIATSAVGSLRQNIKPGNLVFPDQFIDFTRLRELSFFNNQVIHTPMAQPFDKNLRKALCQTCRRLKFPFNRNVTLITIEGPRFSTKAESLMFRAWGADIINMSTCPEVILANELKIPYQLIAMSTDYDCWKENEKPVTWEIIQKRMKKNTQKVKQVLINVLPLIKQKYNQN